MTVEPVDGAPLRVLFIGGTGTISAACVRRAAQEGMQVTVLNRGLNARDRSIPASVTGLLGDIRDRASVRSALEEQSFDSVVNFLCYDADQAQDAVELFRGRTRQYVHISTAALYHKPILHVPITESTARGNDFVRYARQKIAAEDAFLRAHQEEGFPVTVVRPSHTYDDANPPLPGAWTIFDRIERGDEMVVHGDGTSLWTLTHADDFAVGLVGLIGQSAALGEAFHITSDDVLTWDQIYTMVADSLGVEARLVHVPSEFFPVIAPDWSWSELVVGDLTHSAIFDTSKIRSYVPRFSPQITFQRSVHRLARWRAEHPELTRPDPSVDATLDLLVRGYHQSRAAFTALAAPPHRSPVRDRNRSASPRRREPGLQRRGRW